MNTTDAIELAETAVSLSRLPACKDLSAYTISMGAARLARLGREARTHAENVCNFPMPEGKDEKRRESITRRTIKALADLKIDATWRFKGAGKVRDAMIEVHGDPRGSCLQIHIKRASGLDLSLRF